MTSPPCQRKPPSAPAPNESFFVLAPSGQAVACQAQCGVSTLRLQADGVRRGQEHDVPPMWERFLALRAEV